MSTLTSDARNEIVEDLHLHFKHMEWTFTIERPVPQSFEETLHAMDNRSEVKRHYTSQDKSSRVIVQTFSGTSPEDCDGFAIHCYTTCPDLPIEPGAQNVYDDVMYHGVAAFIPHTIGDRQRMYDFLHAMYGGIR